MNFANVPINFILEDDFDLYGLRYLTDAGYELHNESPILNVQADEPTAARITEITASPTTTAR